ncbi:ribosome maturation factor RimM [Arhodomonas sp. AD133]|uniref:ribosome maturation factor RimM n=1 Tax=Arhodomonas sp. AD133 TaxID=3415009 RepID=UPI003EBE9294
MNQCGPQAGTLIVLGEIVGVHGVQGWVKVYSWTRPAENILEFPEWLLAQPSGDWPPVQVTGGRRQGKGLIARLAGISDRDSARTLIGRQVAVTRDKLPPAEPGEYYWADLVGLRVGNLEGIDLGTVDHLIETGAHDVLVVAGERERLIPFVPDVYVLDVDFDAGRMQVDWDPDD